MKNLPPLFFLILATTLEAFGDAVVRMGVYNHAGLVRLGLFGCGATLLFGYGLMLNLAPLEFGRVVGLYIATLFVVWQFVNFLSFRTLPTAGAGGRGADHRRWSGRDLLETRLGRRRFYAPGNSPIKRATRKAGMAR
jgi:hypothetical protein